MRRALLVLCLIGVGTLAAGATVADTDAAAGWGASLTSTATPANGTATPSGDGTATQTANGTANPATETDSPVGTCPQYRGAVLCDPTPPPTGTPALRTPISRTDDVETIRRGSDGGPDDWFGGVLPLLLWGAAVVVLAPAVLGGLLLVVPESGERDR